jgi:hypothetical protein
MLELPCERPLAGTEGPNVPYFFVGDERFALSKNILRPFGSKLGVKKSVYKNRLCRARRFVDRAFGILSNKWRIFHRPQLSSLDFEVAIVKAGVVLHNFFRERDGYKCEDAMTVTGLEGVPDGQSVLGGGGGVTTNNVRNKVADYFLTDGGAASWQMSEI